MLRSAGRWSARGRGVVVSARDQQLPPLTTSWLV